MPLSMTAFARAETDTNWGRLSWELRSVNHRYLELAPRLPEEFRYLEARARELVARKLARGKVDLNLRFQMLSGPQAEVELDNEAVSRLLSVARQLQNEDQTLQPLSTNEVLQWPGVLRAQEMDRSQMESTILDLLEGALKELISTRGREGQRLGEIIAERLGGIATVIQNVKEILPEVIDTFRERITKRLADIKSELDPDRLEQEMVIFCQKVDVDEELDRLETHVEEVTRVLKKKEPMGRRLDFLMQELNREANTLGSKAADVRITKAAVDLKVLIEQMREQVQNLE